MRKPDVSIHLDKRRKKDSNLFPIKIRVALSRKDFRLFSTGIDIIAEDFERIFCANPKPKFKEIKNSANEFLKRAQNIVDGLMPFFTYESFRNKFTDSYDEPQQYEKSTLLFVFNELCYEMKLREQLGNISIYKQAINSIFDFAGKKNMYF